ncbi:MAG: hypothetical protein V3R93_06345 [Candidatus Hydrothermarchaeaceae archaeon]
MAVIDIPGVISLNEAQLSVIALLFAAFLVTLIRWRFQTKRTKSLQKMVDEMDTEKADMYSKLKSFEEENKSLKEKSENTEQECSEKMQLMGEKEKSLDENSKTVKGKLLEIKAMEDTIELHRTKIGRLELEKSDLERKLDSATSDMDQKMFSEKEKLKNHAQELKQKTKEAVTVLKKENEELDKKYEKLKERLSLWESVKDL